MDTNDDQFARIREASDLQSEQNAVKELCLQLFAQNRTELLWPASECCKFPESARLCFTFLGYVGDLGAHGRLNEELSGICSGRLDSISPVEAIAIATALANIGGIEGKDYLQQIISRDDEALNKVLLLFAKRCTRFSEVTSVEGLLVILSD